MTSSKSKSVNNLERINSELERLLDANKDLAPKERDAFRKAALEIYRLQIEHSAQAFQVNVEFKEEIKKLAAAITHLDT